MYKRVEEKILSLFSQDKDKNSLWLYFYVIVSGFGSLLMFFLIKQSLPINRQETKEYYQQIVNTRQQIISLERELLKIKYSPSPLNKKLLENLEIANSNIGKLQHTPRFISRTQQEILKDKLETQESLLDDKLQLLQNLEQSNHNLSESCLYLPQLKNELLNSNQLFASSFSINNQLVNSINNLLRTSILYCQNNNPTLISEIKKNIQALENLLKQEEFSKYKIIVTEFKNYGKSLIAYENLNNTILEQISLNQISDELYKVEEYYLDLYQEEISKINIYRLLISAYLLIISIFVAYRIISHLSITNRNIVKVLEGLTEELETKVEQRTSLLEESIQNTESALAQAQNANKAKSTFLANMSHELRTPLNAILGFTQLMCRDSGLAREHQDNLKIINRSGEHLLKLINDILEMSKIEVGRITLNETKFDLYNMLNSLEQMLRLKVKAKNLAFVLNIGADVPQFIYTDEGKLRQIIINLLGNALKFTEQGTITLTVKKQETKAKENQIDFLFSDTYSLYFAVQDTGPGIRNDEMEKLFSPFEQTETGRTSSEGTGLGLSICYKFAELMGGELKVDSVIGQGSTFFFEILVREQEAEFFEGDALDPNDNRQIIGLAPNQSKYRILAVDDVVPSRLLLNKLLSGVGYLVEEAGNGLEAIEMWEKWHPDLILMDMRMPVMNGYEATRHIKSQIQDRKTIVIALTASAFEEEKVKILSAGCDDFMRKPFQERELLVKIGQYLKVDYLYEEEVKSPATEESLPLGLTAEDLAVMSLQWRSQLHQAASKVDNQEIYELLQEIPAEYESLAQGLKNLVEDFRCDKIIDLAKSPN